MQLTGIPGVGSGGAASGSTVNGLLISSPTWDGEYD